MVNVGFIVKNSFELAIIPLPSKLINKPESDNKKLLLTDLLLHLIQIKTRAAKGIKNEAKPQTILSMKARMRVQKPPIMANKIPRTNKTIPGISICVSSNW
jgi:hypothetical protein